MNKEESNPQELPPKKVRQKLNWKQKLIIAFGVFCFIWFMIIGAFYLLWNLLQEEFPIGNQILQVHQPQIITPLHYKVDSITLIGPSNHLNLQDLELSIHPFAYADSNSAFLNIDVTDLKIQLPAQDTIPKTPRDTSSTDQALKFTDFDLPINFAVHFENIHLIQDTTTLLNAQGFKISNPSSRSFRLNVNKFTNEYLPSAPQLQTHVHWTNQDSISVDLKISQGADSLVFHGEAPKSNLMIVNGEFDIQIHDPVRWTPPQHQEISDLIYYLKLKGSLQGDLSNRIYRHQTSLKSHLKSIADFPAMKVQATTQGTFETFKWTLSGAGKQNERLNFTGTLHKDLSLSFQGKTSGIYRMMTDYHRLPINAQINRGVYRKGVLTANLQTQDGSLVDGKVDFNKKYPKGNFKATISNTESWAINWTEGNLDITGAEIDGQFQDGIMIAHVLTSTPHAYGFAAENVDVNLKLDADGIYFWESQIQKRGYPLNFSGKVVWKNLDPYYQFEIQSPANSQESSLQDILKIYGDDDGHLQVNTSNFDLKKIPLKDTTIFNYDPGILTGYYHNNFATKEGQAKLFLRSEIDNQLVDIQLNAILRHDTLIIDSSSISHLDNEVEFAGKLRFNHTLEDSAFFPYEFHFNPKKFNLGSMSQSFLKGQIKTGDLSGEFNFKDGKFQDSLMIRNLTLTQVDSSELSFPYVKIEGDRNNIDINGRALMGTNHEWDGEFQIQLKELLNQKKQLHFGFVPLDKTSWLESDQLEKTISFFTLKSETSDLKNFRGAFEAVGDWNLPSQLGVIQDINLKGPIYWNSESGLEGLSLKTSKSSIKLKDSSIPVKRTQFRSRLNRGILGVEANLYDSLGQAAKLKLNYDLSQKKLGAFDLIAPQYFIQIDTSQTAEFYNARASLIEENNILSINFSSPQLKYAYSDDEDGHVDAKLTNIQGTYTIPLQTKDNKSYKARVQADAKIASLEYNKHDFSTDFVDVGRRALGSFFDNNRRITRKSKKVEKRPIELNINLEDSGKDSLFVRTNLSTFPITANLQISGTSTSPIFSGGIYSTNEATIDFSNFSFDVPKIGVNWDRKAPKEGLLEVGLYKELPWCTKSNDSFEEYCPVDISINGTIQNPQLEANANCTAEEVDTRKLFSSLALGCISNEEGDPFSALTYKILSAGVKKYSNLALRDELIQDLKFNFAGDNEVDSNSVYFESKLPFLQNQEIIKNLRIKGQFVWDAQTEGEYSDYQMLGLDYIFFDSLHTQTGRFEDGKLTAGTSIINKEYLDPEDEQKSQQALEWNIGFQYQNTWWGDFCFLNSNYCINAAPQKEEEEDE